jgi:hypothetical protein
MEKLYKGMSLLACAALVTLAPLTAKAVTDGSFETAGIPNWTTFNFAFQLAAGSMASGAPHDGGTHVLQVYGPFNSNWDGSGAFQNMAASANQTWTLNGFALNPSGDALQGTGFGLIQLVFKDSGGTGIGTFGSANVGSASPTDQWIPLTATGLAPNGTVAVSVYTLKLGGPTNPGGSIYFDDLSTTVVPEPSSMALALAGLLGFVTVLRKRRA